MINTIFYYPQTLTFEEYLNQLGSEIAARTIVFAKDQKSIYMGGKKFGASSASDISDLKQYIENVLEDNSITNKIEEIISNYYNTTPQDLPTASTTKKGCIKVGSGLVMGNDEKLNVDFSNLPSGQNGIDGLDGLIELIIRTDTSARASYTNFGVVRVGSGITCENGVISVELTKGDKGDKGDTGAKGDKGDTGDRGPAGPSYDDTTIRSMIANNIANLQALIDSFDGRVQAQVEEMLEDVQWMQEHWPSGSGSTSNFGQSDVESYLQMIGVWEENEAHTKLNAKWSKISQSIDNITARVQALEVNSGTSTGSALTAEQILQIAKIGDLETAIAGLNTSYADLVSDENNELKVLRWLSSALDLYSNANATWADLASAALNKSTSESGIAALQTRVAAVENGLISDARLTTLVQNKVNDVIGTSGFVSTSALSDALQPYATSASMFAAVGDVQSDVDSAIASINVCARYETEVVNGERVPKNYGTVANPKYKMESSCSISADNVDFTATNFSISADRINLDGDTIFNKLSGVWHGYGGALATTTLDFDPYHILYTTENSNVTSTSELRSNVLTIDTDSVDYRLGSSPYGDGLYMNGSHLSVNGDALSISSGDDMSIAASGTLSVTSTDDMSLTSPGSITLYSNNGDNIILDAMYTDVSGSGLRTDAITNLTGSSISIEAPIDALYDINSDGNINAQGNITAEGNITADNFIIRNNGNITVRTGGSISTPSITVGSSNDNSTLSYNSVDSIIDVNTGMCLDGELQANNIWLANNGGITIGSDTGFTGTIALGGGTLTFKGGILVDTTLSTV